MNERDATTAWAAGEWAIVGDPPAAASDAPAARPVSRPGATAWAAGEWAIISEHTRPRAIVIERVRRTDAVTRRALGPARRTWAAGEWAMPADVIVADAEPDVSTAGVPHEPLPPVRAPMSRLPALPVHRESSPRMTMSRTSG